MLDEGRDVLRVRVDEIELACACGKVWRVKRAELLADGTGWADCPQCGERAGEARHTQTSTTPERRGRVLSFPRHSP